MKGTSILRQIIAICDGRFSMEPENPLLRHLLSADRQRVSAA